MVEWTRDQERLIREEMGVDPSVLRSVVLAYNAAIRGEQEEYHSHLAVAIRNEMVANAGDVLGGPILRSQVRVCMRHCLEEVAGRLAVTPPEAERILADAMEGRTPPPLDILDREDGR